MSEVQKDLSWSTIREIYDKFGEKPKLYEILVPVADNNGNEFGVHYHHKWDAEIIKIAGGLTLQAITKGKWMYTTKESMIPVRIAATAQQMANIADFTMEHYNQDAVMYYLVSPEVTITTRKPKIRT